VILENRAAGVLPIPSRHWADRPGAGPAGVGGGTDAGPERLYRGATRANRAAVDGLAGIVGTTATTVGLHGSVVGADNAAVAFLNGVEVPGNGVVSVSNRAVGLDYGPVGSGNGAVGVSCGLGNGTRSPLVNQAEERGLRGIWPLLHRRER